MWGGLTLHNGRSTLPSCLSENTEDTRQGGQPSTCRFPHTTCEMSWPLPRSPTGLPVPTSRCSETLRGCERLTPGRAGLEVCREVGWVLPRAADIPQPAAQCQQLPQQEGRFELCKSGQGAMRVRQGGSRKQAHSLQQVSCTPPRSTRDCPRPGPLRVTRTSLGERSIGKTSSAPKGLTS